MKTITVCVHVRRGQRSASGVSLLKKAVCLRFSETESLAGLEPLARLLVSELQRVLSPLSSI